MKATLLVLGAVLCATHALADEVAEAKAAYAKADIALNTIWKELKSELAEAPFAELQREQRDWLKHRDYIAEFNMVDRDGKPLEDAGYLESAAHLTEARVAFLASYRGIGEPGTWPGVWTDSHGGRIEIVERDGILYFRAACVRGPTHHVGDISGIAKINRQIARFSDRSSDPEKAREAGETWLTFIQRRDYELEVIGANTGYYHGARAYFDGSYRRIAQLDPKASEAIVKAATAPAE